MLRVQAKLLLLLSIFPSLLFAQETGGKKRDLGVASEGVLGLVVNQTITPSGYEFYKAFALKWSEKPDSERYSLYVNENLSKRYGNSVAIYLGAKRLYMSVLPAKHEDLLALCEKAAEEVLANIVASALEADGLDIVREEF